MELFQVLAADWCFTNDVAKVQNIISTVIFAIQIAIPILLILFGMLDLGKAVVASKEEDIKKGQQLFIKRLIAAALVFLVVFVVKVLVNLIAPKDENTIIECVDRFINGVSEKSSTGGQ